MSLKCLHNCDNLMFSGLLYHELESAKLRAWRTCVLTYYITDCILMCSRAWRAYVLVCLTCSSAWRAWRTWRAYVLMCLARSLVLYP